MSRNRMVDSSMMCSKIYNLAKKIINIVIVSICVCVVFMCVAIFIYSQTIHGGADYATAKSAIKNQELINLSFEQCYDTLYESNYFNDFIYAKLKEEHGEIHKTFKDINYSYTAYFYAGNAEDGKDGLSKDFLYKIYFDENKNSVYAELVMAKG